MRFDVVTVFPELVAAVGHHGIAGRGLAAGLNELITWNPRDYAENRHARIDDRPYGGGPGMVMQVLPLRGAVNAARDAVASNALVIQMSPQGEPLDQGLVEELALEARLILVCGRYEGIDERFSEAEVDRTISVGDYVTSGGELPAMTVVDAVSRLVPGVLGHADSAAQDSFSQARLDSPHYTRPELIDERGVPDVLKSGDHGAVARWRLKQSLGRTWLRRPELLENRALDRRSWALLDEFIEEYREARL